MNSLHQRLQRLQNFLRRLFMMQEYKKISSKRLMQLLLSQCNMSRRPIWALVDTEYKTVSLEHVKNIIHNSKIHENKYVPEEYDCDDFALQLASKMARVAGGIIHVEITSVKSNDPNRYHAINLFVDNNLNVHMIEPQTGKIFKPREDYKINFIYI